MKNILVLGVALLGFSLVMSGFINGPANRGHDKTGSPVSDGSCMNCHSSNSFSPNLTIKMFDGETEVTGFELGKKYTLRYHLFNTGSPAVFGYQTVALTSNDKNAGTFSDIPNGFQQISLNGAEYVEHSSPRPTSTFDLSWTAPSEANGSITIYAGGVAANSNSNPGGDGGSTTSLELSPNTSSTKESELSLSNSFDIISNPVNDKLNIRLNNQAELKYLIYNQNGKLVFESDYKEQADSEMRINTSDLDAGIYFFRMIQQNKSHTEKFIKI